ncbi:hypothetical protein LPJ70_007974, partial [Coemansia sp. RSA 2708]
NQIMERVMRIEQQLSTKQLDSDVVFDLFTPATKLKTSRGWLKHARELEQKGDLERALVHYQEALRYAPELNKLDTHIAKLRAKLRRQNRRSSIASQGAANLRIADQKKPQGQGDGMLVGNGVETDSDDDDVGPLWMRDGLAESPGAEKAKRRDQTKPARAHQPKPAAPPAPATKPADKPAIKRRRVLGDSSKRAALAAGKKFTNVTEGSVHDRRISFGGSQNPFVVGGNEFNSELQRRLDKPASLCTKKLVAKSAAAAQLRRTARQPPPTPDDRNDKDFVPQSASSSEDSDTESLPKLPNRANGRR